MASSAADPAFGKGGGEAARALRRDPFDDVPVVNDMTQGVGVRARGHFLLQETADDDSKAVAESRGFDIRAGPVHNGGKVEQDSFEVLKPFENRRQEGAVPAADIHDLLEGRKIIGVEHGDSFGAVVPDHRMVENLPAAGVLRHVIEPPAGARATGSALAAHGGHHV